MPPDLPGHLVHPVQAVPAVHPGRKVSKDPSGLPGRPGRKVKLDPPAPPGHLVLLVRPGLPVLRVSRVPSVQLVRAVHRVRLVRKDRQDHRDRRGMALRSTRRSLMSWTCRSPPPRGRGRSITSRAMSISTSGTAWSGSTSVPLPVFPVLRAQPVRLAHQDHLDPPGRAAPPVLRASRGLPVLPAHPGRAGQAVRRAKLAPPARQDRPDRQDLQDRRESRARLARPGRLVLAAPQVQALSGREHGTTARNMPSAMLFTMTDPYGLRPLLPILAMSRV